MGMVPRWRAVVGLALVCLCACTSALEHFEAGRRLESTGDYALAAERYIAALERDATLVDARARLEALVPIVLSLWLEQARVDRVDARSVAAAERFLAIDELVADARGVGMESVQDSAYPYQRRDAFDAAIERLFLDSADAREQGRYGVALAALDRVPQFEPNAPSRLRRREERAQTHLDWGRSELRAGRFRAAFDQADLILAALGEASSRWVRRVDELQAAALEVGTIRLVVFPVTRRPQATGLSAATLDAIDDELVLGPWQAPPLFVALLDQAVVRSYLRREGYTNASLTPRAAGRLGRALDADMLVTAEIGELVVREEDADVQPRTAQTVNREPAIFRFVRARLRGELTIDFTLVDVDRGRAIGTYRASARVDGRVERAEYDGDWTTLRLSDVERRLFSGETVEEAHRELETRAIPRLAERFGAAVFRRVLERVP